jgi:hypothetical protein
MKTLLALVMLLLLVGCAPSSSPKQSTYVKHTLGDNRYFIEVENTQGASSLTFQSSGKGTTVDNEHYELTWGLNKSLKIDNGKLQVNGVNYGEVKPGARIVVNEDGKLLIDGKEAIAPP